ncbi:hypothetical protein NX059_006180 [Plenodomus lindquistii]|nr:hypothetical protein NX059_006180 [Plenodomus lindquistii]
MQPRILRGMIPIEGCPPPRHHIFQHHKRTLILTFDAFSTLFHPRHPIEQTYATHALSHNIPVGSLDDPSTLPTLLSHFKSAFQRYSRRYPNYGRYEPGNFPVSDWWDKVIRLTFAEYMPGRSQAQRMQDVPEDLVKGLISHFASKKGYELYPDVLPLFNRLRVAKKNAATVSRLGVFDHIVVGVITNSDTRVPKILSSLGLKVGPWRAGHKLAVEKNTPKDKVYDVDFVVTSYHAGVEKPRAGIFDKARAAGREIVLEKGWSWRSDGRELVHVGDDYEKDYLGANEEASEWKGVLLAREGEGEGKMDAWAKGLEKGVERIASLEEVPGLFGRKNIVRSVYLD